MQDAVSGGCVFYGYARLCIAGYLYCATVMKSDKAETAKLLVGGGEWRFCLSVIYPTKEMAKRVQSA